jgi:tetratricopeptide (TPR) repeat protein
MRRHEQFAADLPGRTYTEILAGFHVADANLVDHSTSSAAELFLHSAELNRRLGRLGVALELFRRAKQLFNAGGNGYMTPWCLWGIACTLRVAGDHHCAYGAFRRAAEEAVRYGNRRAELWSRAEISEIDRIVGRRRRAYDEHFRLLTGFEASMDTKGISWAFAGIAQILLVEGCLSKARDAFYRAQQAATTLDDAAAVGWALRGRAEVARRLGAAEDALALANQAIETFEQKRYKIGTCYAKRTIVETLVETSNSNEAALLARQLVVDAKRTADPRLFGYALRSLARAESATGELLLARRLISDSAKVLRSIGVAAGTA